MGHPWLRGPPWCDIRWSVQWAVDTLLSDNPVPDSVPFVQKREVPGYLGGADEERETASLQGDSIS